MEINVDENQNESQTVILSLTIMRLLCQVSPLQHTTLKKINNDIDMYNKSNDQALENIRQDLIILKSSPKNKIESCLNNATLRINTNLKATDKDNFNPKMF